RDDGFDGAEVLGQDAAAEFATELHGSVKSVDQLETKHASARALLACGQVMIRRGGEEGVLDRQDAWVLFEPRRDIQCVRGVLCDSKRQRLQATNREPRVVRRL